MQIQQNTSFQEAQKENEEFLSDQLITYIGNKRYLLNFIGSGVNVVRDRLNAKKLSCFDVFSGSGAVSRYLKQFSHTLITNDLEEYACLINRCYLANKSEVDLPVLQSWYEKLIPQLEEAKLTGGFIRALYAPSDIHNVQDGERCFYTAHNAMYLDTARNLIDTVPENLRHFFLAPLLSEASIHANTSGVFKGFYKNSSTGKGQFGGNNKDALSRILGNITLKLPVFSNFECKTDIFCADANLITESVPEVDLAYLDPPYNQHPYGSNYFMLNLLLHYKSPEKISEVSGIPIDWKRSDYNKRQKVFDTMKNLVEKVKAKYLLISFNSEGFISKEEMVSLLNTVGKTEVLETTYNTFRGSRNLGDRNIHVKEYLYLVEKF